MRREIYKYYQHALRVFSLCLVAYVCTTEAPRPKADVPNERPALATPQEFDVIDTPTAPEEVDTTIHSLEQLIAILGRENAYLYLADDMDPATVAEIHDYLETSGGVFVADYTNSRPTLTAFADQDIVDFTDQRVVAISDADCSTPDPLAVQPSDARRFIEGDAFKFTLSTAVFMPDKRYDIITYVPVNTHTYTNVIQAMKGRFGPVPGNIVHGSRIVNELARVLDEEKQVVTCVAHPTAWFFGALLQQMQQEQPDSLVLTQSLSPSRDVDPMIHTALHEFAHAVPTTPVIFFNSYGNRGRTYDGFSEFGLTSHLIPVAAYDREGLISNYSSVPPFSQQPETAAVVARGGFLVEDVGGFMRSFYGTSAAAPAAAAFVARYLEQATPEELEYLATLSSLELIQHIIAAQRYDHQSLQEYTLIASGEVLTTTVSIPHETVVELNKHQPMLTTNQLDILDKAELVLADKTISRLQIEKSWNIEYPFTQHYYNYAGTRQQPLTNWLEQQVRAELQFTFTTGQRQVIALYHQQITDTPLRTSIVNAFQKINYNPDTSLTLSNFSTGQQSILTIPNRQVPGNGGEVFLLDLHNN